MTAFPRSDTSIVGRWWWTVDRWSLVALAVLVAFGVLLSLAATPPVAERIGLEPFHFVRRQLVLVPPALLILVAVSMLDPRGIKRLSIVVFGVALLLVILTLATGAEIKGARRWLALGGLSIQPSEFLKPAFAVLAAWLFARQHRKDGFPGNIAAFGLCAVVLAPLLLQPDVGMAAVVAAVWFAQFFLAGLGLRWVGFFGMSGLGGLVAAYTLLPHVASRIDRFIDPKSGDSYQIDTALDAFLNGGMWGRGPGEGTVKAILPDAHSDFVFAVAGEELGLVACLILVGLFAFIVLRGFSRLLDERDLFVLLATAGLLVQFGLQALINMGSAIHLIPTKGMTLPFISYGGSSLIALSLAMGMLMALTRRRVGHGEADS